jgi:hypothetical protein
MQLKIWDVICIAVLCTILTLGLWPFHSPRNNVGWLSDRDGLRFGRPATVFGSNAFKAMHPHDDLAASVEVWLQPGRMWDSGTFLTLYSPEHLRLFSLHQSETDLELQFARPDQHRSGRAGIRVADVFRRATPVFITLSSNIQGVLVYIDSIVVQASPGFRLSTADLEGRLILGDSPRQTRSWKGQFLGLAFYKQALTPHQVLNHYQNWMRVGQPELKADDLCVGLYLFNEHAGTVAHSQIGSGSLHIPEKYTVLDKVRLEPLWQEFEMSRSYWGAVVKNIVGFIPFGFCFYGYWLVMRPLTKPALATIMLGGAVSFAIEFLQSYLPTRESGTTDLITNTAGTALGILLYRFILTWRGRLHHTDTTLRAQTRYSIE